MDYKDWVAEFDKYHRGYEWGEVNVADAREGIAHLRSLMGRIPKNRLDFAERALASFENELTPEARERANRAFDAYRRGMGAEGSLKELYDAAEHAIEELASIADETDDRNEKRQITGPASPLYTRMMYIKDKLAKDATV